MSEHHVMKLASSADLGSLEEAFCKLVDHENEQVAVGINVETGEQTLLRLCDALAGDLTVMPRRTVQSVKSYVNCDRQLTYGSAFRDGARVMRDAINGWTERFDQAQNRYLGDI
ncbi:hypothetical protein [Methylobacterium durans]|uniref:Uncharacterized protein n=1 Tax=Methylobacterium durans TaxID=2202825 RepID=A0A2U8W1Z4_9HYPH|nr:hypothetical protein [Methylobacterium durans]AWN40089.1 hypothetical protein DK389_05465 [Methylobacterium durans]